MSTATLPVADDEDQLPIVRRRSPLRLLGMLVMLVLAAMLVNTLITNERFEWAVVAQYLTVEAVVAGALLTLELTAIAMVLGVALGIVLALMRMSRSRLLASTSWGFVWFFRGTPLLIQLIFWFNLSALYPALSLGIPFGPEFVTGSSNAFITPFVAAVLGLSLNEAAYMAEIVRGGLLGVDRGQTEAAQALGMRRLHMLHRIVLPQAMRIIVPPVANQTLSMLKNTSLVSVLGAADLLHSAQIIYSRTYQTVPLLIVAALWYLAMTSVLSVGQYYVERYYRRGDRSVLPS
ncbi:MAG TPA: amino acid ABC transporter permease [Pseudonocardia sp.]|jgi:polar amino acid transport system permease protein|uniref:amino acid ABC transporter permease n=1 Tax=Pseudonocardia sp. TaxID=60912 RepID=UPI002B849E16|nr:amino acid ABC transporter permease [Pseudonocardia sp.]HTF49897.1 amino acid ABC transporter permease [Pseudonocardia sp.]